MSLIYSLWGNNRLHFAPSDLKNDKELWLVTLSAIFSSFSADNVNTIVSGQDNDVICYRLQETWSIDDRNSFDYQIQELVTQGYRVAYHPILLQLQKKVQLINRKLLIVHVALENLKSTKAFYRLINKPSIADMGIDNGYKNHDGFYQLIKRIVKLDGEFKKYSLGSITEIDSLLAWDAIYLINICRWAVQVGYIERDEFLTYANSLTSQVKTTYSNWEQVVLAFIIGELIRQCSEQREKCLLETTHRFLTDPFSPVKKVPFN